MKTLTNATQAQYIDAASSNPQKPYFTTTYRDDLLRFISPSPNSEPLTSNDRIPFSIDPSSTSSFRIAGFTSAGALRAGAATAYSAVGASLPAGSSIASGFASLRGSWYNSWYYFADAQFLSGSAQIKIYRVDANGANKTQETQVTGLPSIYWNGSSSENLFSMRRCAAVLMMASGDKIVVVNSYNFLPEINQTICTVNFYHAALGSWSFAKLRTMIQYEAGGGLGDNYGEIFTADQSASRVCAISFGTGKFFVIANDGTKAMRFVFNNGVEGMLEPVVPIDLDANRLEITDSIGQKTYDKYNQFLPTSVCKIGDLYYLNGQMIRTYSNGDKNVMEVFLTSKVCSSGDRASGEIDGMNWSIGEQSFFIDSTYYTKANSNSVRYSNYQLAYPSGGLTIYAIGNNCIAGAIAREIDKDAAETDFSTIVLAGQVQMSSNSSDSLQLSVMKGLTSIEPDDIGGKTVSVTAGFLDYSVSPEQKRGAKIGEYFIESDQKSFSVKGRGPNGIKGTDAGTWKLTRWTSITDIDRWSSTIIKDDLKKLSRLVVKGIHDGYKAIDTTTAYGLYLENLNDPFIGFTSTRDERDGMFTASVTFANTGSNHKVSALGIIMGAEDYTDIYTKGAADRKGFNAFVVASTNDYGITMPQMRSSNLKRRTNTGSAETDYDQAFVWTRRNANLVVRDAYVVGDDEPNALIANYADSNGVLSQSTFNAQPGVQYEFVLRRQSGRAQLFSRKKGVATDTIAATGYYPYTMIAEYQFTEKNRMDWGPRPYWGIVANTDVFSSTEAWNSSEYGEIESTLTEALENIDGYQDFPDSNVGGFGYVGLVFGTAWPEYAQRPSQNDPTQLEWYLKEYHEGTQNYLWLQLQCMKQTLSVGEIVRCFCYTDINGHQSQDVANCDLDLDRSQTSNYISRSEFYGEINGIFPDPNNAGEYKVTFGQTWYGNIATYQQGETPFKFAIYKVGYKEHYASARSGSITANVLSSSDGTSTANPVIIPVDIKTGGIKQSTITAGRAAFINRQNDAIAIRMVESDGSSHYLYSGSRWSQGTGLGWDFQINPVSSGVNTGVPVSTRDWRMLMYQGRIFPFSAYSKGLPNGVSSKAYMIKGDEIVRYMDMTFADRGDVSNITWCVIPAYYTPIFPSAKDATTIQQWSKYSGEHWIEPGDNFNSITNLSGLRLYINGKDGYYAVKGETPVYAVSAIASNGDSNASILTFTPKLESGVVGSSPEIERAKDEDKQLKEIAVLSGRGQFDTSTGLQSYSEPTCFYPVSSNAAKKPDYFIKVHSWSLAAGLYNGSKDNLRFACNLAGVREVLFSDKQYSIDSGAFKVVSDFESNFTVELTTSVNSSSSFAVEGRNAYRMTVNVDGSSLTLALQVLAGFGPASNIYSGNSTDRTIATVTVPVSMYSITGEHFFRVILRKERFILEMDYQPVWTFDLKSYKFGGSQNDSFDLFTDQKGQVKVSCSGLASGTKMTASFVELSDEVENQVIDMSQQGNQAVQFITQERHIYARTTQNGGIQFSRFLDTTREKPTTPLPTEDYVSDKMEYNPFQVPGHALVTGAEYGEHIDSAWIRQNGYVFATNQNRLLDTVDDSIREAKLLLRMAKEDSDASQLEMQGMVHMQPEDEMIKSYTSPISVDEQDQNQVITTHVVTFDSKSLRSSLQIRKKYSME